MVLDEAKRNAAAAAMEFVEDGMVIGLGTGSTASFFVEFLAEEVEEGLSVKGVPTSEATHKLAMELGVPLLPVEQVERIHLTIDGADEIDAHANLIKGGGGALLREKIIANASDHVIVIAYAGKVAETLGSFPLPVEVTPFGFTLTAKKVYDALRKTGIDKPVVKLREASGKPGPLVTDGGNYILDCECKTIPSPQATALALSVIPGVVEHGLFLSMTRTVILGDEEGAEILEFEY
ncbi:ribose-5-phosphate isomerase RpiA [Ponticaulis sp.]|uniref:ribose-5-phosphate isomerase RpiA n=1 Tax=Ponticaulis sp. TaxID=2020902 RepID=UPI000B72EB47|nr:ribose-5-phosphate isomerase RpiA [Ponticaulis sp.]MAI92121.1 ribose 5-phosphate isomerase A [Ponticaulis sp.]OUX96294.1 MAG: ribose 5-phosphate isomerase A [Hyphomonadaceae bacterium TMED5]|tara:strand:+ start:91735 stop:92442 length:708 start_codon:yes stop_codon:yes gene_type:complete